MANSNTDKWHREATIEIDSLSLKMTTLYIKVTHNHTNKSFFSFKQYMSRKISYKNVPE